MAARGETVRAATTESPWIRGGSAAGALLTVLVLRSVLPPAQTETGSYLFVTTFGYGHLLGASLGDIRGPIGEDRLTRGLRVAFVVASLGSIYAAFTAVLAVAPWMVLPMLYASIWHIVENDLAIRQGDLSPPALPWARTLNQHLMAVALTSVVAVLAARSTGAPVFEGVPSGVQAATWLALLAPGLVLFVLEPRAPRGWIGICAAIASGWLLWQGAPWIRFWEVFAAVTCFHLIEWLLVMGARARASSVADSRGEPRRVVLRMLAIHLPAVAVCAVAFGFGASTSWLQRAFSPAGYLLFSLLHVFHTAALRRRHAPASAARATG